MSKRPGSRFARPIALPLVALGLLALTGCETRLEDYDYYTLSGATHTLPPHPVSPKADGVKFTFMPIVGAPTVRSDFAYGEVRRLMKRDKLQVVYGLDEPTTYRVVLHLTAVATNTWTTLVFQVDVHDASGKRVYNYGGQIMCAAGSGDPWTGVTDTYLREVAAQIEGGLLAWTTRPGAGRD